MAGLLRCRRCGSRLQAHYPSRGVRYVCSGGERQRMRGGAKCVTFHGAEVEALLAEELLEVVGPAGVEAARRAAEHLAGQYQQQRQLLVDRLASALELDEVFVADANLRSGVLWDLCTGGTWTAEFRRQVIDDGGIAAADCRIEDLNGDGKPDISCIGASTGNVKLYRVKN